MSRRHFDWHKVRVAHLRHRISTAPSPIAPLLKKHSHHHEIYIPPYIVQHKDTKGNPISLPRVSIIERYDEKGNPR